MRTPGFLHPRLRRLFATTCVVGSDLGATLAGAAGPPLAWRVRIDERPLLARRARMTTGSWAPRQSAPAKRSGKAPRQSAPAKRTGKAELCITEGNAETAAPAAGASSFCRCGGRGWSGCARREGVNRRRGEMAGLEFSDGPVVGRLRTRLR